MSVLFVSHFSHVFSLLFPDCCFLTSPLPLFFPFFQTHCNIRTFLRAVRYSRLISLWQYCQLSLLHWFLLSQVLTCCEWQIVQLLVPLCREVVCWCVFGMSLWLIVKLSQENTYYCWRCVIAWVWEEGHLFIGDDWSQMCECVCTCVCVDAFVPVSSVFLFVSNSLLCLSVVFIGPWSIGLGWGLVFAPTRLFNWLTGLTANI